MYAFISPVLQLKRLPKWVKMVWCFFRDMHRYRQLPGAEPLSWKDAYPCLFDRTATTGIDPHYFYQGIWAFKKIAAGKPESHVDVGSKVEYVGYLTTLTQVKFVDIRPLKINLPHFEMVTGSITELPFETGSISSISCLHVAEHIGLGRYGDSLDPFGTKKGCQELARILAPGGTLLFSLPIGKSRVMYNAHRIHSPTQIISYFPTLELKEFSVIDDAGKFIQHVSPKEYENSEYACGLFEFTKVL